MSATFSPVVVFLNGLCFPSPSLHTPLSPSVASSVCSHQHPPRGNSAAPSLGGHHSPRQRHPACHWPPSSPHLLRLLHHWLTTTVSLLSLLSPCSVCWPLYMAIGLFFLYLLTFWHNVFPFRCKINSFSLWFCVFIFSSLCLELHAIQCLSTLTEVVLEK